ncbi:unnamed protein product [Linum tenue]|uniref:Uncharacterized protein n=1 Tax=Linum tenue TaxID=586396 RepID=A0AAV0MG58_9ROSI|nr:unnamed protein product [Linum tenue]
MISRTLLVLLCSTLHSIAASLPPDGAYPVPPIIGGLRLSSGGKIIDITHRYVEKMPAYGAEEGMGQVVRLVASLKNGSNANWSEFKMSVHSGTHLDSPAHFYDEYFDAGFDVDTLDLEVLNGVDYLSAAAFVNGRSAHLAFLKSREIILVEALKLDNVEAGLYNVHCLPLRLVGAEGSPARCILIK